MAEVAKRVRAEIKAKQKSGDLPAGKISVTCDRFSGGCSLSVHVVDVDGVLHGRRRLEIEIAKPETFWSDPEYNNHWTPALSDHGQHVMATIKAIVDPYHRDDSDSSTDYFNCNFYRHEEIDSAQHNKERANLAAQLAAKARAA